MTRPTKRGESAVGAAGARGYPSQEGKEGGVGSQVRLGWACHPCRGWPLEDRKRMLGRMTRELGMGWKPRRVEEDGGASNR